MQMLAKYPPETEKRAMKRM